MAELNITEVNGNLTVSGGGSFTENVTAPNINDLINNLKEKALSGSSLVLQNTHLKLEFTELQELT